MKTEIKGNETIIRDLDPGSVYIRLKCKRCGNLAVSTLSDHMVFNEVYDCDVCAEKGYDDCHMSPYTLTAYMESEL